MGTTIKFVGQDIFLPFKKISKHYAGKLLNLGSVSHSQSRGK